ncbi:MAG: hypothetical protein KF787_04150 [Phycisphaeraceae bacterium]|nr:hypothetical protein [Phycisphaerae bacterium]MBX3391819.1 hypothetical protein [Phycisphaeraceae bacterium]
MLSSRAVCRAWLASSLTFSGFAGVCVAQDAAPAPRVAPSAGERDQASDPAEALRAERASLARMEQELRKIRVKHFGSIRRAEIRQEGILRLREYTDPVIYPSLITIFERERHDVRTAILDMLLEQESEKADVALAWVAAFDRDEVVRAEALDRLGRRIEAVGDIPAGVRAMIYRGLRSGSETKVNGSAELAQSLKFFDAIPWLITAQFGGPGSSGRGQAEPRGDLAYIVVGTQTAFVSDLTPIVSDSAVAFDPTLSTLTTGTILRIQDAVVTTHRTIVQTVLVRMTTEAWGYPTDGLGFDGPRWWRWYREDYLPSLSASLAGLDRPESGANDQERPAETPAVPSR